MNDTLNGKVALVAGATRGAGRGIAVELGAAGATVYVTGRTTRTRRSDYDRLETIEDTADLVSTAGGEGIAVRVDHTVPAEVHELVERIETEQGRLDVLVNDLGGEHLMGWHKPIWEQRLTMGLQRLRVGIEAHMITSHFALRLLIEHPGGLVVEVTDGTSEYNERYRGDAGAFFDITKVAAHRLAFGMSEELRPHAATAVSLTPGWLRSEMMLDLFGVTEADWREATAAQPHFCISETPRFVGRAVTALATDPEQERWSGRSLSSGDLAQVYGFTDLDGTRPDAWRYMVEVEQSGAPADDAGYR